MRAEEGPFLLSPSSGLGQPTVLTETEPDVYAGIRHALSPEDEGMPPGRIAAELARAPSIALYQVLVSPGVHQAVLEALLGRAGRRRVRVSGADMPVPSCLRLLSRLCREAAEQMEGEVAAEAQALTAIPARESQGGADQEVTPETLRMLQGELNGAMPPGGELEAPTSPAVLAPQCVNAKHVISGFPEYAVLPDKLGVEQQVILLRIASEIAASFKTDKPTVAVLAVGHADVALRKPISERGAFERTVSIQRAENALKLIMGEVNRLAGLSGAGFVSAMQTRAMGMGSTQRLVTNPRTEFERRLNRRVEIFLAQCLVRPGPVPPVQDDTLEKRVRRVLRLLETRRVDPDSAGKRTGRARCMMEKMLRPGVIDVFVDGGVANETINGIKPSYYDCIVPGRNVGWLGNYDGTAHPMPWREFMKFLGTVSPILKGPGFAPFQSDDWVLKVLGELTYRIDLGIEMTDQYITRMGMMSDPIVKSLLQKDGFAGDVARKKLQSLYRKNLDDENNIYSCWR